MLFGETEIIWWKEAFNYGLPTVLLIALCLESGGHPYGCGRRS